MGPRANTADLLHDPRSQQLFFPTVIANCTADSLQAAAIAILTNV
jgi:hypothetical protein